MFGAGLLEGAIIVSFLEEGSDIHWLPLRLFTGSTVTVKHVYAIAPETWSNVDGVFFLGHGRDKWHLRPHKGTEKLRQMIPKPSK